MSVTAEQLAEKVETALSDLKAMEILTLDVRGLTSVTDFMVIASGRSDRQVRALADKVVEAAKRLGVPVIGKEGETEGDWILVDLGDVVAHVMHPTARAYYQLEKLWAPGSRRAGKKKP